MGPNVCGVGGRVSSLGLFLLINRWISLRWDHPPHTNTSPLHVVSFTSPPPKNPLNAVYDSTHSPGILTTSRFLISVFKSDLDLNPSRWHFWWKWESDGGVEKKKISPSSVITTTIPAPIKIQPRYVRAGSNYHNCEDQRELLPSVLLFLTFSLCSPVCESRLTYNPNSFDRDYGLLMRDRERSGESESGVMKQQCRGMMYERLSLSRTRRDVVGSNITFSENSILATHKVISVAFPEMG